jgi:hypothetical protein
MNNLLLVLALAIAFASPASASGSVKKKHHTYKQARVLEPAKQGKTVYDETTLDPWLWTPCDYSNGWKIDACGGGN